MCSQGAVQNVSFLLSISYGVQLNSPALFFFCLKFGGLGAILHPLLMISYPALRLRRIRLPVLILGVLSSLQAVPTLDPQRNLLSGPPELHRLGEDLPAIQAALLPIGEWTPFPRATDRASWESLAPDVRTSLVRQGETEIAAPWTILPATKLLDYVKNGDRTSYQSLLAAKRTRLIALVLAECAEGQGRFLDAITDGLWAHFEESFWGYPAHIFMQRAGAGLPDVTEPIVDLGVGEAGALLAWVDYLLGPELDTVSPMLRLRLRHEVERRLLAPCLDRADFWWMGWDTQGHPINNWNPWIVANWLSAALLLEADPYRRARHVEKAQRVLDIFINHYPADGGCDEGPSYWGRAGASLFEALDWMHGASKGRIDIFDDPLIANMGRYIMTAHVGHGWYINFADANARTVTDGSLVYRYGRAIADDQLAAFGVWLHQRSSDLTTIPRGGSIGRIIPALFLAAEMADQPAADPLPRDGWLPDLQLMTARDQAGTTDGLYVTAKGGHNDESHNHNDVGSFIAYLDGLPLLIDVGPEIYTAKTFSAQRYEIWTMRSSWHNLPLVNGHEQTAGRAFAARDVRYLAEAERAILSLDLTDAYPPAAAIKSWRRDITLHRGDALTITDDYQLASAITPNEYHFLTNRSVDVTTPGLVRLGPFPGSTTGRGAQLTYDASTLTARVTSFTVTDMRLLDVWGDQVYRLDLIEKNTPLAAQRTVEIRPAD
jgi:hypothetical protein